LGAVSGGGGNAIDLARWVSVLLVPEDSLSELLSTDTR
jgi:hypothetical protein